MMAAIRAELRKFFTTRMWWGMGLGVLAAALLFSGGFALLATRGPGTGPGASLADSRFLVQVYTAGLQIGQILCLVVGVVLVGTEFRHRTATATFLATPRRWVVVVAKVVALVVIGLLYGLLSIGTGFAAGAVALATAGHDVLPDASFILRSLALCLLVLVVWALIGLGVGTLVKNQIAAILLAVGFAWIVEPILSLVLASWEPTKGVAKYFPSMATEAVKGGAAGLEVGPHLLVWWQGALVLVAYAAVMAVLGLVLTVRRDIA